MIQIFQQQPAGLIALIALVVVALGIVIVGMLKNRPYRHKERMRAMELGNMNESFFAARLLTYIPWQFWTSFAILLLLVLASFFAAGEAEKTFLELAKYVTGAVIGSLFGSTTNKPGEALESAGTNEYRDQIPRDNSGV